MNKTLSATSLHIFCFLTLLLNFAAGQRVRFELFTPKDGLAGVNSSHVAQDDRGFIWLVNDAKLHRFDGRNFLLYPTPTNVSEDAEHINGIKVYQDSLLFIISEYYAFLLNPKTDDWQSFKPAYGHKDSLFLSLLPGNDIVVQGQHRTKEKTYWRFHYERFEQLSSPLLVENHYQLFLFDTDNNTYILGQDGVTKMDSSFQKASEYSWQNICPGCPAADGQFTADQELIVLVGNQFYHLQEKENKYIPHRVNQLLDQALSARPDRSDQPKQLALEKFILEANGSIWACGQAGFNLIYYDAPTDSLYDFYESLKKQLPIAFFFDGFEGIFQDRTGTVWVESDLGLLKASRSTYPFDVYFTSKNESFINPSLSEGSQGDVYLNYLSGSAMIHTEQKREYGPFNLNSLSAGLYAKGDTIWQWNGSFLEAETGRLVNVPGSNSYENFNVGLLTKDKNRRLWRIFNHKLYYLEKSAGELQWKLAKLDLNCSPYSLHAGRKSGWLWIGCKEKLLAYSPETKDLRSYNPTDLGLPFSMINIIEEDREGNLWLGADIGLIYFNPSDGVTRHFTVKDGLSNDLVFGLAPEGDSCLWISTSYGLSRLHISDTSFINFFEEDGLPYNSFNPLSSVKTQNGQIFFGSQQSVVAFFPEEIMQAYYARKKADQPVLSAFERFDEKRNRFFKEYSFGSQAVIQLSYWDRSFTFEYALPDYYNSQDISYSYKMEGYEDAWSAPSKFNFTRFSSLPAGVYTFRLKARDSQGVWRPEELKVRVIAQPPWWATWQAYLSYLLLITGILFVIFTFLKKRLQLQNQLKLERERAVHLKELDQFKSRFYTNITHEFRTPITVILGMADQMQKDPKTYLQEGALLIRRQGGRLLQLINQLLDLSRLESNAFQLQLQQSDVVAYLSYLTQSFQSYANRQNLSLRFFSSMETLEMDYAPEQIKQILTNLISNAVKFTPSGGDIQVRLKTKRKHLQIEIRDTGIGISKKDLPRIFDRFYQVDSSITRRSEGSGIGLAHTRELVRMMEGQILVQSELGQGTTFLIMLPIRKEAPIIAAPIEKAKTEVGDVVLTEYTAGQTTNVAKKETKKELPQLLIIEDNPDVVFYLQSCLEKQYDLDVAYNGAIGLEKALKNIPDIIISDVMTPGKDGYEVCDILKNDERTSHIPIILLTAKAGAASRLEGLLAGADVYLSKPFLKKELFIRLEKLLELRRKLQNRYAGLALEPLNRRTIDDLIALKAPSIEDIFLRKINDHILDNLSDADFGYLQLASKMQLSKSQLFRKLKALTGKSPAIYIRSIRLQKGKELLQNPDLSIAEIAYEVGFKDPAYFSRTFSQEFGITPNTVGRR